MDYQIFISYRRDGGEALACLINEKLKQRGYEPFYDVESLRSGKFNDEILRVIKASTDVVVILSPNGLERCKNEEDWMRKEIAFALKCKKHIIPIMMRNFEFPQELPQEIDDLRNYNGISAHMEYFDAAFSKLLDMLQAKPFFIEDVYQLTDDKELQRRIQALQDDNSAENLTELAGIYANLHNSFLNERIAKLYTQAADLGFAQAQYELGKCYMNGIGVEKSIIRAEEWYRKAADQGQIDAQYSLATCLNRYYEQIVFHWMRRAADQGHPRALYNIGLYYERGYGVKMDFDLAKKYYAKAKSKGCFVPLRKEWKFYWFLKRSFLEDSRRH